MRRTKVWQASELVDHVHKAILVLCHKWISNFHNWRLKHLNPRFRLCHCRVITRCDLEFLILWCQLQELNCAPLDFEASSSSNAGLSLVVGSLQKTRLQIATTRSPLMSEAILSYLEPNYSSCRDTLFADVLCDGEDYHLMVTEMLG